MIKIWHIYPSNCHLHFPKNPDMLFIVFSPLFNFIKVFHLFYFSKEFCSIFAIDLYIFSIICINGDVDISGNTGKVNLESVQVIC